MYKRKQRAMWGFIGMVTIFGVIGSYAYWQSRSISDGSPADATYVYSGLCNTDAAGEELKSDFLYFSAEDSSSMTDIISRIEQVDGYEKAENCLYVLGKHNAYIGNYTTAAGLYQSLLYLNQEQGVWIDAGIGREDVEGIRTSVQFLREQDQLLEESILRQNFITERQQAP